MKQFILTFVFLIPLSGIAQTTFQLPDGSEIQAYLAMPEAGQANPLPLAIVMGGGAGNGRIASGTFQNHGQDFARRGYAVAVPVSPNGQSFWGDNAEKVRQLIAILKARDDVTDAPVILAGVSNGGISALEIASLHPAEYRGVIAVPGLVNGSVQLQALNNFPVYLRIGSEDRLGWGSRFDNAVNVLERAGVKLDARLLQGTPHTFPMDWPELEAWLATLPAE